MPSLGRKSKEKRDECAVELQDVLNETIKHYDFSVIWGFRGREAQEKAFAEGNSNARWGESKHNFSPSRAFDVIPYPDGFDATDEEFYKMATYVLVAAAQVGVPLRWGGHFNNLKDLAHFELV
jgi:peptidoglycan L-alanyl-D-glutamate endopeptidase CwlK